MCVSLYRSRIRQSWSDGGLDPETPNLQGNSTVASSASIWSEVVQSIELETPVTALLVGGIPTRLKNMKVSWDDYSQYIEK